MAKTLEITDLVKKIKNPLAKYNEGEKTTSIYLKRKRRYLLHYMQ